MQVQVQVQVQVDFVLVVIDVDTKNEVSSIPIYNKDLWTSKSCYFDAYFARWAQQSSVPVSLTHEQCKSLLPVVAYLMETDTDPFISHSISDWYGIIALAEHWGIESLVKDGVEMLRKRTYFIDQAQIMSYYSEGSCLSNIEGLVDVMKDGLYMQCGDNLDAKYYNSSMAQEFMSLPRRAVVTLFKDPRVSCSHENIRLLLLNGWITANHDDELAPEEFRVCIRACDLSVAFLVNVVPRMKWFAMKPEQTNLLLHQKVMSTSSNNKCWTTKAHGPLIVPFEWISPRSVTRASEAPFSFVITKPFTLLNEWLSLSASNECFETRTMSKPWHGMDVVVVLKLDGNGYLYLTIESYVTGFPLDVMFEGHCECVFYCRSFEEVCLNENECVCVGEMTVEYLCRVFPKNNKELKFNCVIEKST